jgi:methyl-accepting chemotaxis protein
MCTKLTIGKRLGVTFGLAFIMLIGVAAASDWGINSLATAALGIFQYDAKLADYSAQARAFAAGMRQFEKDVFLYMEAKEKQDESFIKWDEHRNQLLIRLEEIEKMAAMADDRELIKVGRKSLATYEKGFDQVRLQVEKGELKTPQEATLAMEEYQDDYRRMEKITEDLSQKYINRLSEKRLVVNELVKRTTLTVSSASLASIVLLSLLAIFFVHRHIRRQVMALTEVFTAVGMGDFQARVEVTSGDELGRASQSLNQMLDHTLGLIQSREERDRIQRSTQKLLEEVSGVAQGDLTVEAEVTSDATGAIADSINFMIGELRRVIGDVQDTTLQVSSAANEIRATTDHLALGSETQAAQIADTSAAIEEMTLSIQQVSENAALSATVAEQAMNNAQQGAKAVEKTIEGMSGIREQVQKTAKRIKRLGESSQEIGEIVQLISDLSDRTSILALNASIQAAMAGEAGRGFAVVAEEVERLAERSTEATKKVATLIKTIQTETNEAVAAMEDTTHEVVSGSNLANEAGLTLREIQTVSNRLAELIQSISMAAKQQARGSEAVAKSMTQISQITQQTASGTKQAAVSINSLATLTENLRASVSTFKLPSNGRPKPPRRG